MFAEVFCLGDCWIIARGLLGCSGCFLEGWLLPQVYEMFQVPMIFFTIFLSAKSDH